MNDYRSLSHSVWECKHHTIWIPKYRKKNIYQGLRKYLGPVFRELAEQKESRVEEGHLMPDHVHMLLSIPPKYSVAQVIGFIKGKSAIQIARTYVGRRKNFTGQDFWARGYFVSTVVRDEEVIREYIKKQEEEPEVYDRVLMPGLSRVSLRPFSLTAKLFWLMFLLQEARVSCF